MKPVAIFRYAPTEGPGYFATFLDQEGIPWQLLRIDQGDDLPDDPGNFSGLVFMGGHMSVNDELPWIPLLLSLIRQAVARDIPALGHCLGGQLLSKALGGVVTRNAVKEIGWGDIAVADNAEARAWFGQITSFTSFHWHGETFSIPSGATRILSSAYCPNQGFAMGKYLGLQCHVEMTEEMIRAWCRAGAEEVLESLASPGVQTTEGMQQDLPRRVGALNAIADTLYRHWITGLNRG